MGLRSLYLGKVNNFVNIINMFEEEEYKFIRNILCGKIQTNQLIYVPFEEKLEANWNIF